MHAHVQNRIMAEVQGACIGRNGYVITIYELNADGITTGLVDLDTGALNVTGILKTFTTFLFYLHVVIKHCFVHSFGSNSNSIS